MEAIGSFLHFTCGFSRPNLNDMAVGATMTVVNWVRPLLLPQLVLLYCTISRTPFSRLSHGGDAY